MSLITFALGLTAGIASPGPALPAPWLIALVRAPQRAALHAIDGELAELVTRAAELARTAPGSAESRAAWEAVLARDPEHRVAHRALGHHLYEGAWYPTYAEVATRRAAAERERLEFFGEVRLGERWVPYTDAPYLKLGWQRDARGRFAPPTSLKLDAEAGWTSAEGGGFQVHTTLPGDAVGELAAAVAQVGDDLARVTGLRPDPSAPLPFVIVESLDAYNRFAAGEPNRGVAPTEASGTSAVHYAYFADAWFEPTRPLRTFRGVGVGYWQRGDSRLEPFGAFAARHAAARSWLEVADPSPAAMAEAVLSGSIGLSPGAYWAEKALPRWLHVGAAMYAERFFLDRTPGVSDPAWARRWAVENLAARRAELDLERVFACELDGRMPDDTLTTMMLAGLTVAFVVDGDAPAVRRAHDTLLAATAALGAAPGARERRACEATVRRAASELEYSLRAEEGALRAFAR